MTAKFHSPLLGQLTANFAQFKIRRELFRDDDIICFFRPERAAIAIVPNRLIYITSVFHFGPSLQMVRFNTEFLQADTNTSERPKKANSENIPVWGYCIPAMGA